MDPITSALPLDSTTATTGAQAQTKAKDSQNEFLQLLVAQLKGQNPLDPMDGSAFVAQLAQFSSLEELTKIRTSMDEVQKVLSQSAAAASQTNTNQLSTNQSAATASQTSADKSKVQN
jgi:flagellar basal-body rod modification protein FlgD